MPHDAPDPDAPDGPGELSFGPDASPVSGPVGSGTTWQVPTRRRGFSIRYARSVVVEFFVETTGLDPYNNNLWRFQIGSVPVPYRIGGDCREEVRNT